MERKGTRLKECVTTLDRYEIEATITEGGSLLIDGANMRAKKCVAGNGRQRKQIGLKRYGKRVCMDNFRKLLNTKRHPIKVGFGRKMEK